MKKNLLFMSTIISIVTIMSTVHAEDNVFIYENNGDGTCKITDFDEDASVDEIELTAINFNGDEIIELDDYVLYKCKAETVKLSGLTAEIGGCVLDDAKCTNLIIEDCNLVVDSSFASNAKDIKSLTITNSTIEFDDYAFYKLGDEAEVVIDNSTIEFGGSAFAYADIISLVITSSEIEGSSSFFSNTEDTTSIEIIDSTIDLDDYAFFKTGDKATVSLTNCTGEFGGSVFAYAETETLKFEGCSLEFGNSAFSSNEKMLSMEIRSGNYEFGDYAFFKCNKLTDAIISGEVDDNTFIFGSSCGQYCDDLVNIEFGKGSYEVGKGFFAFCESLENIIFADSASVDGAAYLFYDSSDIAKVAYDGQEYSVDAFAELVS